MTTFNRWNQKVKVMETCRPSFATKKIYKSLDWNSPQTYRTKCAIWPSILIFYIPRVFSLINILQSRCSAYLCLGEKVYYNGEMGGNHLSQLITMNLLSFVPYFHSPWRIRKIYGLTVFSWRSLLLIYYIYKWSKLLSDVCKSQFRGYRSATGKSFSETASNLTVS